MKTRFALLFFLFCTFTSSAQNQYLKFVHYTVDKGLSNASVLSIDQDKQGFLWIATEDGLCKYDGLNTVVYKHNAKDTTTISSNFITKVVIDKQDSHR